MTVLEWMLLIVLSVLLGFSIGILTSVIVFCGTIFLAKVLSKNFRGNQ